MDNNFPLHSLSPSTPPHQLGDTVANPVLPAAPRRPPLSTLRHGYRSARETNCRCQGRVEEEAPGPGRPPWSRGAEGWAPGGEMGGAVLEVKELLGAMPVPFGPVAHHARWPPPIHLDPVQK
jgi:hypothetical protein